MFASCEGKTGKSEKGNLYEELNSCDVIVSHLGLEGFFSRRSFPECDEPLGFKERVSISFKSA